MNSDLIDLASLASQFALGIPVYGAGVLELQVVFHADLTLIWVLEIQIPIFMLAQQAFNH